MKNNNLNEKELMEYINRLSNLNKDLKTTYYMAQEKAINTMGKLQDLLLQMKGFMKAIIALCKNTFLEEKSLALEKKLIQLNKNIDGSRTHIQIDRKIFQDFQKEIDAFYDPNGESG